MIVSYLVYPHKKNLPKKHGCVFPGPKFYGPVHSAKPRIIYTFPTRPETRKKKILQNLGGNKQVLFIKMPL